MITSPSHTLRFGRIAATLAVAGMARACDFYVDAMGFSKAFENGEPVGFVILKRDSAELHLTLQRDHRPAPFAVAHMLVEDIDALHAIIRARGLRIVKGLRAFVFEDPDGNRIDVGERI